MSPYTGRVKTALPLTDDQIEMLCEFFEGVLESMEHDEGRTPLYRINGAPLTKRQRSMLGRVWYKLRRHYRKRPADQSGPHVAVKV